MRRRLERRQENVTARWPLSGGCKAQLRSTLANFKRVPHTTTRNAGRQQRTKLREGESDGRMPVERIRKGTPAAIHCISRWSLQARLINKGVTACVQLQVARCNKQSIFDKR